MWECDPRNRGGIYTGRRVSLGGSRSCFDRTIGSGIGRSV
jgi:hypothetical protein